MWQAKPSGAYAVNSAGYLANIAEMNAFFNANAYTLEAQAGIIGNSYAESGLNPWRWQSDSVSYSAGYGLFQFTPARDYINNCKDVAGYAPNLSVTAVTTGANPGDGGAQLTVFATDKLQKWVASCWRSYWDASTYADLYALRAQILAKYGTNNRLSMTQFAKITDIRDATFAFLACYEGPLVPNLTPRYNMANAVYPLLTGDTPTPSKRKKMPVWMYLKYD